jgi:hypothetical protein
MHCSEVVPFIRTLNHQCGLPHQGSSENCRAVFLVALEQFVEDRTHTNGQIGNHGIQPTYHPIFPLEFGPRGLDCWSRMYSSAFFRSSGVGGRGHRQWRQRLAARQVRSSSQDEIVRLNTAGFLAGQAHALRSTMQCPQHSIWFSASPARLVSL